MIGNGIYNSAIFSPLPQNSFQVIATYCMKGILKPYHYFNGVKSQEFELNGLLSKIKSFAGNLIQHKYVFGFIIKKIKLLIRSRKGCDDGC